MVLIIALPCYGAASKYAPVYDPHGICYNIGQNGANILLIGDSVTASQYSGDGFVPGWEHWVPQAWSPRDSLRWKGICHLNSRSSVFGPADIYPLTDIGLTRTINSPMVTTYYPPFSGNSYATGCVASPWFTSSMTVTLNSGLSIPVMRYGKWLEPGALYVHNLGRLTHPVQLAWNDDYSTTLDPNTSWLVAAAANQTLKAKIILDANTNIPDLRLAACAPGASIQYDLTALSDRDSCRRVDDLDTSSINNHIGTFTITMPSCSGGYQENGNGEFQVSLGLNQTRNGHGEKINILGVYYYVDDANKGIIVTNGGISGWWTSTFQDANLATLANMQTMAGIVGWDTIIITLGMNDIIGNRTNAQIIAGLKGTLALFRQMKPGIKFIITTYYPSPYPRTSPTLAYQQAFADLASSIIELPDEYGDVAVINTWAVFPNYYIADHLTVDNNSMTVQTWNLFSKDGVHLTQPGSFMYAKTVWLLLSSQFDRKLDWPFKKRVDFFDFTVLAKSWLQSNPLADIAPEPAGDGIVDIEDLAVLCDNWLVEK
jgi:lysophospholipase L1-like esterase